MKRAAVALLVLGCASMGPVPGGPPDTAPPQLLRTTPDSGRVNAVVRNVVFTFDEVVSETPRGGTLASIVLVSPSDGPPDVSWNRKSIDVHPRHGWHANTTYVVTLLPGIADLRGNVQNARKVVVFSTGSTIPDTRVTGAVFDWSRAVFAPRAYVEAHPAGDTTLKFATEADSLGRFTLPYLAPGTYDIRAIIDANHNRQFDARELWDSATVTLRDSAGVSFYAFVHDPRDTVGPSISGVSAGDSLTLRVGMTKPLWPDSTYAPTVEIRGPDSTLVQIARVVAWPVLNEERARAARERADSVARADTSAAAAAARTRIRQDSANRAAVIRDSIARDTVKRLPPPKPERSALVTDVGVVLHTPLKPATTYQVRVLAKGVLGAERASVRPFLTPKPPPDSTKGRGGERTLNTRVPPPS